jgi:purine-binding chemotaxis protein CheW
MDQERTVTGPVVAQPTDRASIAGKYMAFKLDVEEYAIEILKVREIIGLMDIIRVPRTKEFIRGVINLRGRVIPVVDLRLKFHMTKTEATDQTVIIVVQFVNAGQDHTMGVLVDEVLEVLNIRAEQIEPPPDFGPGELDTDFILGMGKADKRVLFLLDIGKVLSSEEAWETRAAAEGGAHVRADVSSGIRQDA